MPELPDLDLAAEFGDLPTYGYRKNLSCLLECIEKEPSLPNFRNQLFGLIQLYAHEIVEFIPRIGVENQTDRDGRPVEYSAQELTDVLDDLMSAGVIFTGRFYTGSHDVDDARELVLRHAALLDRFSLPGRYAKIRHLNRYCRNVQAYGKVLYSKLGDTEVDFIVPIFSGGVEPACLARYVLGQGEFFNLRYSRLRENDDKVIYVGLTPQDVQNQSILICEDWIQIGESSNAVIDELAKGNPAEIILAAPVHMNHYKITFEFEEKIAGSEFYGRLKFPLTEK